MEYAAFVWSPHTINNINKLEAIQRRAAHYVMANHSRYSSVDHILSILNWKTLKQRRDIQSLCILYKIINGLVDITPPACLIHNHLPTRGHTKKFHTIYTSVSTCIQI